MFETIQKSNASVVEWAVLLIELVSHGVIDAETNGYE